MMDPGPIRLNKALAQAGVCSRRKADELVFSGAVAVNGVTADSPGIRVWPERDSVTVNGRPVAFLIGSARTYLMLNKPVEVVSTASDPEGRRTVLDLLPPVWRDKRLYPVGRLDYFSEGLILLTDDGDLTHRLTHPSHHMEKVYQLLVRGAPTEQGLQTLRQGMTLAEGERLAPVDVRILKRQNEQTLIEMTLRQGVNRQIRRMCRDLDLTVLKLTRVRQGPLELGSLGPGKVRELGANEVAALRKSAGLPRTF